VLALAPEHPLPALALAGGAAVGEELLYRGVLLALLLSALGARRAHPAGRGARRAVAVALATACWALAHGGLVDPAWWALAQTGALGLVLGGLVLRHGLGAAIATHLAVDAGAVLAGALAP